MPNERDRVYWQWLAVRIQQGDPSAADKLVEAFQKPLLFYLRRLLLSEDEAWDCVQETWISSLRGIRRLRKPEAVASFIYQVGRNHAMAMLRRRTRLPLVRDEELEAANSTEEVIFTSEDAIAIREALDRLPNLQREILTLSFLNDLSAKEISDVLDIPAGTVKSRLFHAKHMLRSILIEMGYSHEH
jgi:RNA polymerase sigma factor (sigma-70 family)